MTDWSDEPVGNNFDPSQWTAMQSTLAEGNTMSDALKRAEAKAELTNAKSSGSIDDVARVVHELLDSFETDELLAWAEKHTDGGVIEQHLHKRLTALHTEQTVAAEKKDRGEG